MTLFEMRTEKDGVIRLEQWPEGVVLWAGGEIRWKSWEQSNSNGQNRGIGVDYDASADFLKGMQRIMVDG